MLAVPDLVSTHLFQNDSRFPVLRRQLIEMTIQMMLHLTLGFRHESKADTIADPASQPADGKRASVPQWIEQTGAGTDFVETFRAPAEMVLLFARRLRHRRTDLRRTRSQLLRLVKRLRTNLANMIDAH